MQFLKGFLKTAALTVHNDGTEFKVTDNSPAPYEAGHAYSAPTGIAMYMPEGKSRFQPAIKDTPSQLKKRVALSIAMGKEATISFAGGDMDGSLDYVGTKSDAADTLATQLKWDKSYGVAPADNKYTRQTKPIKKGVTNGIRKRV